MISVLDRHTATPYEYPSPRAFGGPADSRSAGANFEGVGSAGYQEAVGAPVFCGLAPGIGWARAIRRLPVTDVTRAGNRCMSAPGYPLELTARLAADSRAEGDSQPSCDQTILPDAETSTSQGWS